MKFLCGLLFGIAITSMAGASHNAPVPQPKAILYDYKIECFPKNLQKWGDEGWELVATSAAPAAVCLYLKKPKG